MDSQQMRELLNTAEESRKKHSTGDRLFALEIMVCAIGASLEGSSRESFLKTMNSFSTTLDPMKDSTVKAIADLNVLSSDFIDL